jgi:hypothetical protein
MNSRWSALRKQLVNEARSALQSTSFQERNEQHARSVAQEGAELATAAGLGGGELLEVFHSAALEAGAVFATAFSEEGERKAGREGEYKNAVSAAGPIAYRHWAGQRVNAPAVVTRARASDLALMLAKSLGVAVEVTEPELLAGIRKVVPSDDSSEEIAKIPKAEGPLLSGEDRATLALGLRLAHATWKAGQVHRAAWEGDDRRVNSEKRIDFLPYDAFLARKYEEGFRAHRRQADAPTLALCGVVFEVYKDLLELEKANRVTRRA